MENMERQSQAHAAIGGLSLDACVVLASSTLSAGDVDRARRGGNLRMSAPADETAYLEVGGVVVAEGRMKLRHRKNSFVVTRTFNEGSEVLS